MCMLAEIHMLCAEAQARVAAQEVPKYSSGTEQKGAESARFTEYPAPPIWKAWLHFANSQIRVP